MKKFYLILLAIFAIAQSSMAQKEMPKGNCTFIYGKWMKDGNFRFVIYNEEDEKIEVYNPELQQEFSTNNTEYLSKYESREYETKYKFSYNSLKYLGNKKDNADEFYALQYRYDTGIRIDESIQIFYNRENYNWFYYNHSNQETIYCPEALYEMSDGSFGYCKFYRTEYQAYSGDWQGEKISDSKHDIIKVQILDQDDCGFDMERSYLSQTFFNDDEKMEFVRLKLKEYDCYEDQWEDDTDIPSDLIPCLANKEEVSGGNEHYYHEHGYEPIGLEVVNETGDVLYTLDFPEGMEFRGSDPYFAFIKSGNHIYALVDRYEKEGYVSYSFIYDITSSPNAIVSTKSNLRGDNMLFNLSGIKAGENAKGVLIQNGRKFMRK